MIRIPCDLNCYGVLLDQLFKLIDVYIVIEYTGKHGNQPHIH